MGKEIKLEAQARADEKMKDLRAEGLMPAVMYGSGSEATSLKIKAQDFNKVFAEAGESTLIDIVVDGKDAVKVIVKDIQRDAIKGNIQHVDFYTIDMKNKIEVEIRLNFVGESKAVKELGGTLLKSMEAVTISCLPGDLVEGIDVDLAQIETFDDTIRVSDLVLPETLEVVSHGSSPIATVEMPRSAKKEIGEGEEGAEGEEKKEGEEGEEKKEGDAEAKSE